MEKKQYQSLTIVEQSAGSSAFHLYLNRPSQSNALSSHFFTEFPLALSSLDQNPNVNVIILAGAGKHFCAGIDLSTLTADTSVDSQQDNARSAEKLRREIKKLQDAITAVERCRKPVIACVHGACIGAGIDLVTACDVRYCTRDAVFCVKEVDLAITADLGTLQRLPSIVGYGNAAELALTARRFSGTEAKEMGLVSGVYDSKNQMEQSVALIAQEMAGKSPLAVRGTKAVLLRSKELNTEQGLDYVATWNSYVLISPDLSEAISAHSQKRKPVFAKL